MGAEATRTGPAYAALAVAAVLWGASFPLGKIALGEMGAATLVFYRFVLAAGALLPFVRWRRVTWARRDTALLILCALLVGPGMFLLQFEGLDRTTASSAALLVATAPPMMAVAATLFDGERPGRLTWIAVGLAALEDDADAQTLWNAANLEEDWQVEQWGQDAEAAERRARRFEEFLRAYEFAKAARA